MMRLSLWFVLPLAWAAACKGPVLAAAKQGRPQPFDSTALCEKAKEWTACIVGHEQRQLAKHHPRARRNGQLLQLTLKIGSKPWGLTRPRWRDDTTLELERVTCERMGSGEGVKVLLRHGRTGWQLESMDGTPVPR